jgi:uncharacterized circularly permuted ATP-grasp superfamily protein
VSRINYDEMRGGDAAIRPHYQGFADWLQRTPAAKIAQKRDEAERAFHRVGITFAVYGEDAGTERLSRSISFRASSRPPNGERSSLA